MKNAAPRCLPDGTQALIEELAQRYQAQHHPDVAQALLDRCRPLRVATIRQLIYRYHLARSDGLDLLQVANVAILEAADRYRPPDPFPAFARLVIRSRGGHWIQSQQRAERHLDRTGDVALLPDDQPQPDQAAIQQERRARVAQVFQQLDPEEQRLWELLADKTSMIEIATTFAISVGQARRQVARFRAKIRALLPEEWL